MNLDEIWLSLETEIDGQAPEPAVTVRRINPTVRDGLFLGIRRPSGTRMLLLQIPAVPRPSDGPLIQSRGFTTAVSRFSGDARHFQLFIESASASFNEVFGHVAADVVEHMLRRPASSSAIPTFLGRLLRWKRFFESAGGGQLSEIASQGILAELLFLRDFAIRNSPTNEAAVSSWALPEPFSKDFQFPHGAVEVKCSLSREHTKVHINGERQLDDAGYSSLYLLAVMMERVLTEGFSLPETVNSIREILGTGIARFLFEDKLLDFGYLDAHSTQYSQRYILHRLRAFHVTEGFPRVPPMLPDGLGDLCYTVSLAACAPFEVDIDVLHSLVRGGN